MKCSNAASRKVRQLVLVAECRRRGLPYRVTWFSDRIPRSVWPMSIHYQARTEHAPPWYTRVEFHTLTTELQGPLDSILASCSKTTRNEIASAEKMPLRMRHATVAEYVAFHNAFAAERGLRFISVDRLSAYREAITLRAVILGEDVLAMHATLLDRDTGTARLLYSSSSRLSAGASAAAASRANRWLHMQELLRFREDDLTTYDWGGVSTNAASTPSGVDAFKLSFGGALTTSHHFIPKLAGSRLT